MAASAMLAQPAEHALLDHREIDDPTDAVHLGATVAANDLDVYPVVVTVEKSAFAFVAVEPVASTKTELANQRQLRDGRIGWVHGNHSGLSERGFTTDVGQS
jgi:hypothetical protein